jgi:hypothetical protein
VNRSGSKIEYNVDETVLVDLSQDEKGQYDDHDDATQP